MLQEILKNVKTEKNMDEDKDEIIIDEEIIEESGLQEKLKKLRSELKTCQTEKAGYLAGWQRAKADFINARRDEEKSKMEFVKYSTEIILREMLAVADSLELADNADGNAIYKQLVDILKKEGVMQIEALNKKFDPMYHEALSEIETKNRDEDGVVLEELQKGYTIHDRVLRPSKVKVGIYKINRLA